MSEIIKAAAKAIYRAANDGTMPIAWPSLPEASKCFFQCEALAAWTAGVGALTDRQVYEMGPLWDAFWDKFQEFNCESPSHGEIVAKRRAALLNAAEEPTDD